VSKGNWRIECARRRTKLHVLDDDNCKPIQKLYTKSYIQKGNACKEDGTIEKIEKK